MKTLLRRYLTSFFAVYFTSQFSFGLIINGNLKDFFYVSLILALILSLKPFLDTILFPLNLITLNMTGWLIYLIMIYFWSLILPQVHFGRFYFSGLNLGIIQLSPFSSGGVIAIILISVVLILFLKAFEWLFH